MDIYALSAVLVQHLPDEHRISVDEASRSWWFRPQGKYSSLRLSKKGFDALTRHLDQQPHFFPCLGLRLKHIIALSRVMRGPYYLCRRNKGPVAALFSENDVVMATMHNGIIPLVEGLSI